MQKEEWNLIAEDYYDKILSPIKNSIDNPLFDDLKGVANSSNKIVDLGCGLGELAPILSKSFKEVMGVDISEEMISRAKEKNSNFENVNFLVGDISSLRDYHNKFDVAVSVNSIISPDLKLVDKMFLETNNILKKGGKFICILPSMEVFAYQALLIAQKYNSKTDDLDELRKKAREFINDEEHDFLLGMTDFDGKQKYYYRFEILWRLKKAGFQNVQIKKVFYPWKEFKAAGQKSFPGEDLPWDWYVICEK